MPKIYLEYCHQNVGQDIKLISDEPGTKLENDVTSFILPQITKLLGEQSISSIVRFRISRKCFIELRKIVWEKYIVS